MPLMAQWKGIVLDANTNAPIPWVNIFEPDADISAKSKSDGSFSIVTLKPGATIYFSYPGYKAYSIKVLNPSGPSHIPDFQNKGKEYGLPDTVLLEAQTSTDIVVTGNRTGQRAEESTQSIEFIKQSFLLNTQSTEIQQALTHLPGIQVQKDEVTIRGGSGFSYGAGSRIMVLIDGMPLLSADASDAKWSYMPIENINQVEILKGPASVLYGSSAMEGIIHLRTANASRDSSFTEYKHFTGVYDKPSRENVAYYNGKPHFTIGNTLAHRQQFGIFSTVASISQRTEQGWREGDNSNTIRAHFNTTFSLPKNKDWSFLFSLNGYRRKAQEFFIFKDYMHPYDASPNTVANSTYYRWHTDVSATYSPESDEKHPFPIKHIIRSRYYTTINVNDKNQNSTGVLWFNEYQLQKTLYKKRNLETNIVGGIVFIDSKVKSDSLYGRHEGYNIAAYAQIDQKIGKLHLSAGARIETNRLDTNNWKAFPVFRSGLNYQLAKASFLRASIGQGFRYPSVAEKFTATHSGAIKIFPNPNLESENGWGAELGFRQLYAKRNTKGYIDLSGFASRYHNLIEYVFGLYLPPGVPQSQAFNYLGFAAKNIPETQISGAEASIGLEQKLGKFTFDLMGGYTYINPLNKNYNPATDTVKRDKYLNFRRPNLVRGNLDITYKKVSMGIYTYYNSPFLNMDEFFIQIMGFKQGDNGWINYSKGIVTDTRISYKGIKHLDISFYVKNLFNKEYMEVPGNTNPPRTYTIQLIAQF